MKKFLSVLIALVMTFSVIGFSFAETDEPDPEPEFVRPVDITAVDENGDVLNGVELQLADADGGVVKTWTANGEKTLVLPEGEYTLKTVSAPDGYLAGAEVPVTVARLQEEKGTFIGKWKSVYDEHICTNQKHVGLEMFWIEDGNGVKITDAYCFNHGFKNPSGVPYKAFTATEADLFHYAVNKSDSITPDELYRHVMYIMLNGKNIVAEALANEGIADTQMPILQNYLMYMSIKHYTDPKKFPQGVLQAIKNHADREHLNFTAAFEDAFDKLINPTSLPEYADGLLYFYIPQDYTIKDENSYQILISAKEVPHQDVKIGVHPAAQFRVTLKFVDSNDKEHLRPAPDALIPLLHLYADGEEVTNQYVEGVTVTDNGNSTYTVKFANLLPADYTMKIDGPSGYLTEKDAASDGGTITLTHFIKQTIDLGKPLPIKPIKPIKPIPVKPPRSNNNE